MRVLVLIPAETRTQAEEFCRSAADAVAQRSAGSVRLIWAGTENLGDWSDVRKRLHDELQDAIGSLLRLETTLKRLRRMSMNRTSNSGFGNPRRRECRPVARITGRYGCGRRQAPVEYRRQMDWIPLAGTVLQEPIPRRWRPARTE